MRLHPFIMPGVLCVPILLGCTTPAPVTGSASIDSDARAFLVSGIDGASEIWDGKGSYSRLNTSLQTITVFHKAAGDKSLLRLVVSNPDAAEARAGDASKLIQDCALAANEVCRLTYRGKILASVLRSR